MKNLKTALLLSSLVVLAISCEKRDEPRKVKGSEIEIKTNDTKPDAPKPVDDSNRSTQADADDNNTDGSDDE